MADSAPAPAKGFVVTHGDLYALIGEQHVELILLRKRVAQLESAAAQEVSRNGKGQEEGQAEGQAAKR